MGALDRRPVVDREERVVALDLRQEHPRLRREDRGAVRADVAGGVGDRDAVARGAVQAGHRRARGAVVQGGQRGALGPVDDLLGLALPQAQRELLRAAHDAAVVVVGLGVDDAQDLQDGVREVGVPAARSEADLAEDLALAEGLEGLRLAQEPVEGLVVELLDQLGPDLADARDVPLAHRGVHVGEVGALVQAGVPRGGDVAVDLREVGDGLGVVGLALEVHDRRGGGLGERVREGLGDQADEVDVVLQGRGGRREAHGAHLRGQLLGTGSLEADGAQPAADLVGLVDDGLEAHLHELVRRDDAGQPAADDGDLGAEFGRGYLTEARRVGEEVVVRVREVRTEHGDRRLSVAVRDGGGGHRGRHGGTSPCGRAGGRGLRRGRRRARGGGRAGTDCSRARPPAARGRPRRTPAPRRGRPGSG